MGYSPIVSPLFLMESSHKDWKINIQDKLNHNFNMQFYQDWVENSNNQDHKVSFVDKNF